MIYVIIVLGTIALIFLIGKITLTLQFNREVHELFSQSMNISDGRFRSDRLAGLPDPVRRYFEHVLKDGLPYISYVRLKHDGQFKTGPDKGWSKIDGEQYFTTEKPGFIWKGNIFGGSARDMYLSDKGRLVVTVLWLFTVVNGSGETFDEGELQRWIAESVWFPTNLLPSERMSWSAIDRTTANLSFKYKNVSTSFIVSFNEAGEITQMETRRFMDPTHQERWLVVPSEYNECNSVIIPTKAEVIWKLESGDLSYAKFRVKTIEYDKPERF